jgi:hypothetical protein
MLRSLKTTEMKCMRLTAGYSLLDHRRKEGRKEGRKEDILKNLM